MPMLEPCVAPYVLMDGRQPRPGLPFLCAHAPCRPAHAHRFERRSAQLRLAKVVNTCYPSTPCLPPAGRPELGPVYHACTSTTYKRTLGVLYGACCAYLNARPPAAVGWVAPKAYHIDALHGDAAFRARCAALNVKLCAMTAALRADGQRSAAKKARLHAFCSMQGSTRMMVVSRQYACTSLVSAQRAGKGIPLRLHH